MDEVIVKVGWVMRGRGDAKYMLFDGVFGPAMAGRPSIVICKITKLHFWATL